MKQILTIFKKDVRHLWIDLLLCLAVVVGFAVTQPFSWPGHFNTNFREAINLQDLFIFLLPLSWWLLIARVVLDESLVGDRAFWLTRPYGWQRILTAKFLFISAFVALPLFLAKAWLLSRAGLSPFTNLLLLILNVFATALIIFLPLLAIAAVTATLVRMFFVVLAGCLYIGLAAYINQLVPYTRSFGPDTTPFWIFPLCICVCAGVVLLQYSRRMTWVARTVLIVLVLVVTLITSISEHTWNVHRRYADLASNEPPPFSLVLNPDRSLLGPPPDDMDSDSKNQTVSGISATNQSAVPPSAYNGQLSIPLILGHVAASHAVRIDDVAFAYNDPVSRLVSNGAQPGSRMYLPGEIRDAIHITLGPEDYRLLSDKPLALTLILAITEFEVTGNASSTVKNSDFALPNGGICHPPDLLDEEHFQAQFALQNCQFPIDRLPLTLVTTHWSDQTCNHPSTLGEEGAGWIGSDEPGGLRLDFSPVQNIQIFLSGRERPYGKGFLPRAICPGAKVTFTNYRVTRRRLLHITLPPILPRDYTKGQEGELGQVYREFDGSR